MAHRAWHLILVVALAVACGGSIARGDDPRLKGCRVAPGFKVELAAAEPLVINPVAMTFGDDGKLYVIEWVSGNGANDRIKVLTDKNRDGVFDTAEIWMDGLELPAGLMFWDGWTYISLGHDVVRFHDPDRDGKYDKKERILSGFGNDNSHHRVSGLTMGPDGWIYITTGDSDAHAQGSDGSSATVLRCGGVFRCKPDGTRLENVAFGMRNPFGNVAFSDEFRLFHTDNDNEGSPGFTGCRILHVVDGGDYGWRLREGARCCQPDYDRATWNGGQPGRLGWITETGRGAPAGLCVLNSAAFPPSTRNLLVYPDVFRKKVRAYKLKETGATYGVAEEFELLASDDGLFRPDDAEIGPDGALYILDWRTDSGGAGALSGNGKFGRIYRVTWSGAASEPARTPAPADRFATLAQKPDAELLSMLGVDDYPTRRAATLELIRRIDVDAPALLAGVDRGVVDRHTAIREALFEIARDDASTAARLHATSILSRYGTFQASAIFAWVAAIREKSPTPVRRYGFESIARYYPKGAEFDHAFMGNREATAKLLIWTRESDPQALRGLAMAYGRFGDLRRSTPEDHLDAIALDDEYRREYDLVQRLPLVGDERAKRRQAVNEKYEKLVSSDLVARKLLWLGRTRAALADPFLRDGVTRGLEGLGPVGLEAVVAAIKANDPAKTPGALFALEGWRSEAGLNALILEATGDDPLPPEARVALFRALRELGPAVPPGPIAAWLARARDAAEAKVAAIKVLAAMKKRAAGDGQVVAVLPRLIADDDPAVRRAAIEMADVVKSDAIQAALIKTVAALGRPDEQKLALIALRDYGAKGLTPLLLDSVDTATNPGLKAELLRTAASTDYPAAARKAEALLDTPDVDLRAACIALLGQKPATALIVAKRYNAGKLPAADLARVLEAIRTHATPEIQAETQTMLRSKLLAAPTGAEAAKLRDMVMRRGNAERGKTIFLSATKGGCAACHRLEGVGNAVGPDLTKIYETMTFDKRVEAILEPSKEIKEGYATYRVVTNDGRTMSGLLVADTPEAVTLKDAQGKEIKILARDVDSKGLDKVSLMPAGVVGHLSFNDLADLLAFLGDRPAQERLRLTPPPQADRKE